MKYQNDKHPTYKTLGVKQVKHGYSFEKIIVVNKSISVSHMDW
jgi:hypothetical protein